MTIQAIFSPQPASTPLQPLKPLAFGQKKPLVAHIDSFERTPDNLYDIDGDGVGDLSHGELVARLLKSTGPVETAPFALKSSARQRPSEIVEQLRQVYQQIQQGKTFDAVILPQSSNHFFQDISLKRVEVNPHSPTQNAKVMPQEIRVNAKNLAPYRKEVQEHFAEVQDKEKIALTLDLIEKITRHNIPVYLSAGNMGPNAFNAFTLASGTLNVGANLAGENPKKSWYTADNSLVNRYEQGSFAVTRLGDDFDLTGNGKPDVFAHEVSGGKSIAESIMEKPQDEARGQLEDLKAIYQDVRAGKSFSEIPLCREKVFRIHPLVQVAMNADWLPKQGLDVETLGRLSELGDFLQLDTPEPRVFKLENDRFIHNPDNSGRQNAVNQISGTSFAAPFALGKDLTKRASAE